MNGSPGMIQTVVLTVISIVFYVGLVWQISLTFQPNHTASKGSIKTVRKGNVTYIIRKGR